MESSKFDSSFKILFSFISIILVKFSTDSADSEEFSRESKGNDEFDEADCWSLMIGSFGFMQI
jgi:hypothetical protein